jgi:hypothetical protein
MGDKQKKEKLRAKKIASPPIDLVRPGILPQTIKGTVTDILCCGGNEDRLCHSYNLEKDAWFSAGKLPDKHIVTE